MKYKEKHNRLNKQNKTGSLDFIRETAAKKKKRKVGTGPVAGHNATDTTVRAKQIVMPHQSSVNKDAKQTREKQTNVSHRNLSMEELLVHSKHTSATVRKDALLGMREIIVSHDVAFEEYAPRILGRAFELLIDDNKAVRHALLLLLRLCFETLPERMTPFLQIFVKYAKFALTHLSSAVTLDAMRVLRLAMRACPEAIAPLLPGVQAPLCQLLKAHTGMRSKITTRMATLRMLLITLQCSSRPAEHTRSAAQHGAAKKNLNTASTCATDALTGTNYGFLWEVRKKAVLGIKPGGNTSLFCPINASVLHWDRSGSAGKRKVRMEATGGTHSHAAVTDMATAGAAKTSSVAAQISEFVPDIVAMLWECWSECLQSEGQGAGADSASAARESVAARRLATSSDLLVIVRVLLQLFGSHARGYLALPVPAGLRAAISRYILESFPLSDEVAHLTMRTSADVPAGHRGRRGNVSLGTQTPNQVLLLQVVDTAVCELAVELSELCPADMDATSSEDLKWRDVAFEYYIKLLRGNACLLSIVRFDDESEEVLYDSPVALAHIARKLLERCSAEQRTALWNDLVETLAQIKGSHSALTYLVVQLFGSHGASMPSSLYKKWLGALYKLIWQLQTTDEILTTSALVALLTFARRAGGTGVCQQIFDGMQSAFSKFFLARLRQRNESAVLKLRDVYGPFVRCGEDVQRRAIDLLYYYSELGPDVLYAVTRCAKALPDAPETCCYLLEVLSHRRQQLMLAPALTLILSCTMPGLSATHRRDIKQDETRLERWCTLVTAPGGAACRYLAELSRLVGRDRAVLSAMEAVLRDRLGTPSVKPYQVAALLNLLSSCFCHQDVTVTPAHRALCVSACQHLLRRADVLKPLGRDDKGDALPCCARSAALVNALRADNGVVHALVEWLQRECTHVHAITDEQSVLRHLGALKFILDVQLHHIRETTRNLARAMLRALASSRKVPNCVREESVCMVAMV